MQFSSELESATLIKRYKRFLADIHLPDGSETTIHCANTGSMTGCAEPGFQVYYSRSDNPKRKYPCSWELSVTAQGHWIGINTHNANTLVAEAIHNGTIAPLQGYQQLQQEVKYGEENSRIDILLSNDNGEHCYIEIKSVTLLQDNQGYFPDAVSKRGQKHLRELMHMVEQGHRGVLLFCVQHTGIHSVSAAAHIDPDYAELLQQAMDAGVEVLAYGCDINPQGITITHSLPYQAASFLE